MCTCSFQPEAEILGIFSIEVAPKWISISAVVLFTGKIFYFSISPYEQCYSQTEEYTGVVGWGLSSSFSSFGYIFCSWKTKVSVSKSPFHCLLTFFKIVNFCVQIHLDAILLHFFSPFFHQSPYSCSLCKNKRNILRAHYHDVHEWPATSKDQS